MDSVFSNRSSKPQTASNLLPLTPCYSAWYGQTPTSVILQCLASREPITKVLSPVMRSLSCGTYHVCLQTSGLPVRDFHVYGSAMRPGQSLGSFWPGICQVKQTNKAVQNGTRVLYINTIRIRAPNPEYRPRLVCHWSSRLWSPETCMSLDFP